MRTLSMVAGFLLLGGSAHGQVPVTDVASTFQLIKSYGQDLASYARQGQQYVTELQQLQQLVSTYQAFVANPTIYGAAGLLSRTGLGNSLPVSPYGLASLTSGSSMSFSGLSGKLSALGGLANTQYGTNHIYDCTDQSWACTQQKQRAYGIAGTAGIAQASYQDLQAHTAVVQDLRDKAAAATTPAERENIAVALQAEQVWTNSQLAQVNAAQMQANADQQSLVQQSNEKTSQDTEATINSIPGG